MTFAEQIERLRQAAVTGAIASDLAEWLLARLLSSASAADIRDLRDQLLVAAARALDPCGSTWSRARRLRAELAALDRRATVPDAVRVLLEQALVVDPATPRSQRQLVSILQPRRSRLQANSLQGDDHD